MAALHAARSSATVACTPAAAISCLRHSSQVFLGLPLGRRPGASMCIILFNGLPLWAGVVEYDHRILRVS